MEKIKIYGERNTGTIYLEWLLIKNLIVEIQEDFQYGWKHRLAPGEDEITDKMKKETLYVCLVKNPYSWLLSMHKRPYNHPSLKELSFSQFIKYSYGDYKNPVVMWNLKNRSYTNLGLYADNHIIIKYEDILIEPKEVMGEISEKFNINKTGIFRR